MVVLSVLGLQGLFQRLSGLEVNPSTSLRNLDSIRFVYESAQYLTWSMIEPRSKRMSIFPMLDVGLVYSMYCTSVSKTRTFRPYGIWIGSLLLLYQLGQRLHRQPADGFSSSVPCVYISVYMHNRLRAIGFTCILVDMHFRFPRPHMHEPVLLPID